MTHHEFTTSNEHHHPDVELVTCYRLGAMPYVPHFSSYGVYVAPGGRQATKALLEAMGATPYKAYLWARPDEFSSKGPAEGWKRPYGLLPPALNERGGGRLL